MPSTTLRTPVCPWTPKESTPTEASIGVSAFRKEPSVAKDEDDSANLDHMEVDLSGEEQQLKPRRPILKAHRGADRVPHKLTIQFEDDTNVYSSPSSSRRPSTPHPRKRLMIEEVALVAQEHPSKRARHSSVSIVRAPKLRYFLGLRGCALNTASGSNRAQQQQHPALLQASIDAEPEQLGFPVHHLRLLAGRLSKLTSEQFIAEYILVDCRYPYGYAGGHVKYLINIHNAEKLPAIFFPADEQLIKTKSRTPIFYCELLQKRGPAMSSARRIDRTRHAYLDLDHDTIYVLKDGYKNFFERGFLEHCDPAGYMTMDNPSHRGELINSRAHRLPPITPKVKRPTKGEGRRLRFGQS